MKTETSLKEKALELHQRLAGKIEITSKMTSIDANAMSLIYTPGVAEPCKLIAEKKEMVYEQTGRGNMVAVISDGTAVLGLGDIGPEAAMPVMEGKCVLFKQFADVNAFPICLNTKNVEEIVSIIKALEPTFGGINLEDISAPRCFEIEDRLKQELTIPVFHDDQHGTAIVVLAGLVNALKLAEKKLEEIRIVINGAGAAGLSIAALLLEAGAKHITLVSLEGIVKGGEVWLNPSQAKMAKVTNKEKRTGTLVDALKGTDVFIGVSGPGALKAAYIQEMKEKPIIFAMANPVPEIFPEEALTAGAYIVGTGRSDYPNQINNVLAFPGIFRGVLDARAKDITTNMKIAAAYAIAEIIKTEELTPEYIIPNVLDPRIAPAVALAVKEQC